jgi:hypothetical protein
MLPSLWPGDLLTVQTAGIQDIAAKDIVLFRRGERTFAHRVVEIATRAGLLVTQGDAMLQADPEIEDFQLLGRVVGIMRRGKSFAPVCRWVGARRLVGKMLCSCDYLRGLALRVQQWRWENPPLVGQAGHDERSTFVGQT